MPSQGTTQTLKQHSRQNPRLQLPAIGVLQLPSRAARKARSVTTATRVSSWLSFARNLADGSSSVLKTRHSNAPHQQSCNNHAFSSSLPALLLHHRQTYVFMDKAGPFKMSLKMSLRVIPAVMLPASCADLHAMPMAPWATAGSISSMSRILVMCCVMSRRFRPARASRVALQSPSCNLRRRVYAGKRADRSTHS